MDALAERLEIKLREWAPEKSQQVRLLIEEIIDSADQDSLELVRSRAVEQEVLEILDAPEAR